MRFHHGKRPTLVRLRSRAGHDAEFEHLHNLWAPAWCHDVGERRPFLLLERQVLSCENVTNLAFLSESTFSFFSAEVDCVRVAGTWVITVNSASFDYSFWSTINQIAGGIIAWCELSSGVGGTDVAGGFVPVYSSIRSTFLKNFDEGMTMIMMNGQVFDLTLTEDPNRYYQFHPHLRLQAALDFGCG